MLPVRTNCTIYALLNQIIKKSVTKYGIASIGEKRIRNGTTEALSMSFAAGLITGTMDNFFDSLRIKWKKFFRKHRNGIKIKRITSSLRV